MSRNGASSTAAQSQELFRLLPQLGDLLQSPPFQALAATYSLPLVRSAARRCIDELRQQIATGACDGNNLQQQLADLPERVLTALRTELRPSLRPVINATGVVLHTNLGRAPLSAAAIEQIALVASGYCNLELDLDAGERGRRDDHLEALLLKLLSVRTTRATDGLAATFANNCAGATFLALNTLADGGEVIVSRGELVEIGGGFRVPEILRKSGAVLREVGTTNRTRLDDYAGAITPETRLILRVHQSNFRIEGFTARPDLDALIALGAKHGVPVFEDQGTGCLIEMGDYGIANESSLLQSFAASVPLIAASGDKLLGGPQCGLLIGERSLIESIRKNPLMRAFRVDKLTAAALQATLLQYLAGDLDGIPALRMLRLAPEQIRARCIAVAAAMQPDPFEASVTACQSVVGGGTTPGATLPSFAVTLRHVSLGATALAAALRALETPIVARIVEDTVWLDLRTVPAELDDTLIHLLRSVADTRNG